MRIPRAILIPGILLAYLAVMSVIGWGNYRAGRMTGLEYWGIIALTLLVIVGLHFSIKRRERLRREREDDMKKQ